MNRELVETLREYADKAEAGDKSHWALAMRQAAEYISADLEANEHEAYGKVRYIDRMARRAVFSFSTDLNGNIPKWLKEGAKVYARPQVEKPMTEDEFLNLKLPCDIKIGNGKNGKGTSIKTLLLRANSVYEGAMLIKRNTSSCDEISAFCSDMPDELKIIFRMGVRFAEDRIHGIKGRE